MLDAAWSERTHDPFLPGDAARNETRMPRELVGVAADDDRAVVAHESLVAFSSALRIDARSPLASRSGGVALKVRSMS